ncbi:permease for cytosine/purines uracil thiamine allantoin [Thermaerobacter marianensis DSM 12885]|uniref:Permease for cytosine/purines uracil thiamine allantoin n=1 Tax=Thermaerobacter marianensis (strain ATCC 700841 / DSM 12885 / JCM 10246 / 7p75a) TaxID=644966 RepID=E6SIF0_THEM7|nr:cytosine permease [Thermaerobacter marianensis]ADU51961.1 permease for cytosine/purines uracil thiamine allantoin [Thermaerobacter marianensis DSM 12885]
MATIDTARQDVAEIGHDDFALTRVPYSARYSWVSVAVQRFGQLSALSQFLLGATLGFGMSFWEAFWAITLGAVILEVVSILTGIAGQREGLSTTVLGRWTGFGKYGSTLISLIIAVSLVGWFGIQNAVFAEGVHSLVGGLPVWAWCVVTGLAVTLIVVYGFLSMAWTAYITVPAFLVLAGYSIITALLEHPLGELVASAPPGPRLSLAAGTTLVAGGFIVGAVITPDMTRFNRSPWDVVKQTVVGVTLGEYLIGLIGVLLAHAVKSADVIQIVTSTSGVIGTLILIAATLKINDWNLYSASLGFANLIDTVWGRKINRGLITILVGVLGTALSAAGILQQFTGFLTLLGVTIPPLAGIMVVDYFILRRYRPELDESAAAGTIPGRVEVWNPVMLATWVLASYVGYKVSWGIPTLNALIAAGIVYYVLMKVVAWLQGQPRPRFREVEV